MILSIYVLWAPWMLFPGESSTQTLFLRVMENFLILILIIFLPIWGPLVNVVRLITVILITERRRVL